MVAQEANLSFKNKFPYISVIDEASDFKFGMQLRFAKAHHAITPRGKSGHGLGLGELPKILGFPYNIFATARASDFKFGMQLGFGEAHDKITRRAVLLALAMLLVIYIFIFKQMTKGD